MRKCMGVFGIDTSNSSNTHTGLARTDAMNSGLLNAKSDYGNKTVSLEVLGQYWKQHL